MPSNYLTPDPIQGSVDLDDKFITDAWLVDQFVGGTLFGWGNGASGKLGLNNIEAYNSPIQVGSMINWKQVACGYNMSAAIKTDGTLWNWGSFLGNGTAISYSSPVKVGALTNWKQITCGQNVTLAIKIDGTLWGWGNNGYGELGNNATGAYSSPVQIGLLTNWKQVSCGYRHTGAIKNDGTLWMWGTPFYSTTNYGSLGNGTGVSYSSPIQIGLLTNWKQVSTGLFNSSAVKTDGTLWTWGRNDYGQLGNGTTLNYSSPIQIGSLTNWKQVACGHNIVAIKTDGTLWNIGGQGLQGAIGNNTTDISYSSPIQIGSLTNWKQLSTGMLYTQAIKTDGTLWAWGYNSVGELGGAPNVGNNLSYSSPIQIGLLSNWRQVSASQYSAMAITYKDLG